jgi:iron complex outermembrane receptor protein
MAGERRSGPCSTFQQSPKTRCRFIYRFMNKACARVCALFLGNFVLNLIKKISHLLTVSFFMVSVTSTTAIAADDAIATAAPVLVTATRFSASIDTAPVNVTTITAQDIANSSADTLEDILNYQAGITVTTLFGIGGAGAKVEMGGFGENGGQNTLVLLNGRRLNDLDLDGVNLASIPLESIQQIEIVHGSGTVLYGDNATSGVINIVTKNAFDGEHASIKLQTGSFQTQRVSTDLRKLAGDTALTLNMDSIKSNGYRDNNAYENFSLFGEASREQANWNYGARVNLSRERTGLPGALDEATYKTNPTSASSTAKSKESRNSIEGFFVSDSLATELAVNKKHQEYISTDFGLFESEADLSTVSLTPRVHRQYGRNNIVAGLDIYRSKFSAESTFSSQDAKQQSYAVYFTDAINLRKNTDLSFGLRQQKVKVTADGASNERDDKLTSWDITLAHKHNYGARNYARIAKSFRTPVFDEMWDYFTGSFTLIKPQTGRHYEIGTRQKFTSGLQLDANLFRINLDDEIAYDNASFSNVNLDETRHDGLNINLRTTIAKQTSVQAGYAYRKATFRSGAYDGNDVPLVPRTKLNLSGQHQLGNGRVLGVDAVYTGKRRLANDDNNVGKMLPAYTRVDLNYTQQFNGWKGRIKIQNASNVKVANFGLYRAATNYYYPLPERALFLTFEGEL